MIKIGDFLLYNIVFIQEFSFRNKWFSLKFVLL